MCFFFFFFNYLFFFCCVVSWLLHAAFLFSCSEQGLLFVAVRCAGLSLRWLLLWSAGLSSTGSVCVAHGLSCVGACGIFPDQGSNPCPLHWQADSQPLRHQGSPRICFLKVVFLRKTVV